MFMKRKLHLGVLAHIDHEDIASFALDFNVGFMPYGERCVMVCSYNVDVCLIISRWRLHRRIFHQAFGQAEIPTYHAVQLRSARRMLFSLLQDPGNYANHFRMSVGIVPCVVLKLMFIRFTLSFVLSIIYDYEALKAKDDHIVHAVTSYAELVEHSMAPTAMMVMEAFPFRMFTHTVMAWHLIDSTILLVLQLPSWLPGATYKRASVKCIQAGHDVREIPFQHVKERMVKHFISGGITN
jgi:hypothetical protein